MRTYRVIYKAILSFIILPFLTGCWDRQEIDERALVLAIAIDQAGPDAEQQESKVSYSGNELPTPSNGMIKVTLQIAVPGRIPLGTSGGGGEGGIKTVWGSGWSGPYNRRCALNNLQQRIAYSLFFGQLRIIVLSENVARNGIQNLNDYLRRNPEVRRLNWMVVSQGKASDVMRLSPKFNRVPTIYLMNFMDDAFRMGRLPKDFLGIFWSSSTAKGREGYLPYIKIKGEDNIELSGLAFFKENKLVGTTAPNEIVMYMAIMGMSPAGGQVYVKIPGTQEYVEYDGRNRKANTKVQIKDGRPYDSLKVRLEGNLREKSKDDVVLNTTVLQQMENELSKDTKESYINLIHKTQAQGSDIFGFGEYIRAKEPKYWNEQVKTKEVWQKMYKDLKVDVQVEVQVRRIGMKTT